MRAFISRAGCAFLMLMPLAAPAGQPDSFVPASLSDDSLSLQNLIRFPDIRGDVAFLLSCEAVLSQKGYMGRNRCYADRREFSSDPFMKAVKKAARDARLNPARVNGRRVKVLFQYSVLFDKKDGNEEITVYPSHLLESRLTPGYSGPQRYKSPRRWKGCHLDIRAWVSMKVDEHGLPSDVQFVAGDAPRHCEEMILRVAESQKFIPAMQDGKPVAANHLRLFVSQDEKRRLRPRAARKAGR